MSPNVSTSTFWRFWSLSLNMIQLYISWAFLSSKDIELIFYSSWVSDKLSLWISSVWSKSSPVSICSYSNSEFFSSDHSTLIFCMFSNNFLTEHVNIFRDKTKYNTNVLKVIKFDHSLYYLVALWLFDLHSVTLNMIYDLRQKPNRYSIQTYTTIHFLILFEFRAKFLKILFLTIKGFINTVSKIKFYLYSFHLQ